MAPEPQCKELTDLQKGEIIALSHHYKPARIGRELDIPWKTVDSFLKRFHQRSSEENLPRPGRPWKTSLASDRWLYKAAMRETKPPLQELKTACNIPISTRTIQRYLKKVGVRKWRTVKRAPLTQEHAKNRMKWAREHRYWTAEDWAKVIWSDESTIKKDSDTCSV